MQGLQAASGYEALSQCSLEAVGVCGLAQRHFISVVGLDFIELLDDSRVVNRQATKLAQTARSLFVSVHLDEVSGCLWQEEESDKRS